MRFCFPRSVCIILPALAICGLAGCESGHDRPTRGGSTGGAPMTASGELAVANPKPMDALATFFGDQIEVEVMLAKSDARWSKPAASEGGGGDRGGGHRTGMSGGFGGGGGHRGGGGHHGGGGGETAQPSNGEAGPRPPTMHASNEPPVQLQLRLSNHSDVAVQVEVLDFNSDLGNFVVQPSKILVPPHESVEADPMISRLGVPALEEIPLTVRLRVDGKIETKVFKLRPRAEDTTTPEAPEKT